ncbi:MAG: ATP synthase F1 subunit delta [Leptospiraceae bacterium]|nr:ATP synthase F1 subunit delta [Leptospiraceae bacterium]
MIPHKAAHNYALALAQIDNLPLEQAEAELQAIRDALRADPRFTVFMESPAISTEARKAALRKALGGKVLPAVMNLCLILAERRRMHLIPSILVAFRQVVDGLLGRTYIDVVVAHVLNTPESPLDSELAELIVRRIDENRAAFGLPVGKKLNYTMNVKLNTELLAGIRIRVGDYVFDGTVARNLLRWRDVAAAHPLDVEKAFSD